MTDSSDLHDERSTMTTTTAHHTVMRRRGGALEVARPMRDTSRWHRWRQERACRKTTGHCWHPDGYVDWWCCMCSADTDGMPPQRCRHCAQDPTDRADEPTTGAT